MSKYIALLGAYERDNFGDILFYHVTKNLLPDWLCVPLSLISADMSTYGGESTISASAWIDVCENNRPSATIACGGEVLTCDKRSAVAFTLKDSIARRFSGLPSSEQTSISERICWHSSALPYVTLLGTEGPSDVHATSTIINSAGGTNLDPASLEIDARKIVKNLARATFFSVRDQTTRSRITEIAGVTPKLAPDVVSALPIACRELIESSRIRYRSNHPGHNSPYLLFQAAAKFLQTNSAAQIAEQLVLAATSTNTAIVLQPAGLAFEHDTIETLEELHCAILQRGFDSTRASINRDRDVWSQVAAIAESKCFIGTSLHGRIVAATLGVPRVSLTNSKVAAYAETWDGSFQPHSIPVTQISDSIHRAIAANPALISSHSIEIQRLAKENFDELRGFLGTPPSPEENSTLLPKLNKFHQAALYREITNLRNAAADYAINAADTANRLRDTKYALQSIMQSDSWKVTAPLRSTKRWIYSAFGGSK